MHLHIIRLIEVFLITIIEGIRICRFNQSLLHPISIHIYIRTYVHTYAYCIQVWYLKYLLYSLNASVVPLTHSNLVATCIYSYLHTYIYNT